MELHFSEISTPPAPAATVILLRTGQNGMEVLLQKRHSTMDVLAGAYVFPGGKVDSLDYQPDLIARLDQNPIELARQLGQSDIDSSLAAAYHVAALRELIEEAAVLPGRHHAPHHATDLLVQMKAGTSFAAAVAQVGVALSTDALKPWSRWITPKRASVTSKRFDTLFFVAAMPEGQTAAHDHLEAIDTVWVTPRQALTDYWDRQVELAPPQIMTLAHLSRFDAPAQVLAHAASRPPFKIEPEPHDEQGVRWLCYPGDSRHSMTEQAMPGPTCLAWRNKRFEPESGFDGFFA